MGRRARFGAVISVGILLAVVAFVVRVALGVAVVAGELLFGTILGLALKVDKGTSDADEASPDDDRP